MPLITPYVALATQILKVVEQGQIAFNNAPPKYRDRYFERLQKYEDLADRIVAPLAGLIADAIPAGREATVEIAAALAPPAGEGS